MARTFNIPTGQAAATALASRRITVEEVSDGWIVVLNVWVEETESIRAGTQIGPVWATLAAAEMSRDTIGDALRFVLDAAEEHGL